MNKAIQSSYNIIESSHRAGNLSSFKSELKRMIKLLTKATKKIRYEDKSSEMFWSALKFINEKKMVERERRISEKMDNRQVT